MCAQCSINGKCNPLPIALLSDPPAWLPSCPRTNHAKWLETPRPHHTFGRKSPLAYKKVQHTATPPQLCCSGVLLKAIPQQTFGRCFSRATNAPAQLRGGTHCSPKPCIEQPCGGSGSGCLCYFHPGKGCTDKTLRLCQCPNPATWPRLMILSAKKSLHLFMLCAKDRKINLMLTYKAHKTSFSLNIN